MGNRMSSLNVARYCPKAPKLGAQYGAGRAALMGSAFHAMAAAPNDPETHRLWCQLTEEEAVEVCRWRKPDPIELESETLRYDDSIREVALALNSVGGACEPDDPDCITVGHTDCAWVVERDWDRIAYVLDLKKTEWTVKTAPEKSLQLLAYGLAAAAKYGCDGFCVGIWACTEATYDWSGIIMVDSDEARAAWELIKHAATHTEGEARTGSHCADDCYGRLHCEEWLLPAALATQDIGALGSLVEGASGEMDNDRALSLALLSKRLEDLGKVLKDHMRAYARRHPVIDEESGKRYAAITTKGRLSLDRAAVEREHPGLLAKYEKRGNDIVQVRWKNL